MRTDRIRFAGFIVLTRQDWSSSATFAAIRKEPSSNARSSNALEHITLLALRLRQCRSTLEKFQCTVMTVPNTRTLPSTSGARFIVVRDSRTWTLSHLKKMNGYAHMRSNQTPAISYKFNTAKATCSAVLSLRTERASRCCSSMFFPKGTSASIDVGLWILISLQ